MFKENFHEYNFPPDIYRDLMVVTETIEKRGFYVKLGTKHIAGRIYPECPELHNPVELVLGKSLVSPPKSYSFLGDVDVLDSAMQELEEAGAELTGFSAQLPGKNERGQVAYSFHYKAAEFNVSYTRMMVILLELRSG